MKRGIMLEQIKNRIRNHSYMSQIERDEQRIQATAEHFTPTELVQKMLNSLLILQRHLLILLVVMDNF